VKEREEDRSLYLLVEYKNGLFVPSWLLSDGTLRLLAQTLIPYLSEKDMIYIIEEPENGLHPQAIESVIQSLSSVYDNQVLVATHSPVILRLSEPKDIICFSKTGNGVIDVIRGEDHPKLKNWMRNVDIADQYASGVLS
jgi:predicted ATPase